jgi:hypothetical protein
MICPLKFGEQLDGRVGQKECFYKTILTSPYWLFSKYFPGLPDGAF